MNEVYLNHEIFWGDINNEEFSFISQQIRIVIGFQWILISLIDHIDTVLDKFIEHYGTIESLFTKLKSSICITKSEYASLGWNLCMRMANKNHKMSCHYSEIYDLILYVSKLVQV